MKKVIVLSLIGSLTFAFAWETREISKVPKRYTPEYYVPVIRVEPEVQHATNVGPYIRLRATLEGYKIASKPSVEIKMDRVKNVYHEARVIKGRFKDRVEFIPRETYTSYLGKGKDYRFYLGREERPISSPSPWWWGETNGG